MSSKLYSYKTRISLMSFFEELLILTMDLIPFQMEDILF